MKQLITSFGNLDDGLRYLLICMAVAGIAGILMSGCSTESVEPDNFQPHQVGTWTFVKPKKAKWTGIKRQAMAANIAMAIRYEHTDSTGNVDSLYISNPHGQIITITGKQTCPACLTNAKFTFADTSLNLPDTTMYQYKFDLINNKGNIYFPHWIYGRWNIEHKTNGDKIEIKVPIAYDCDQHTTVTDSTNLVVYIARLDHDKGLVMERKVVFNLRGITDVVKSFSYCKQR